MQKRLILALLALTLIVGGCWAEDAENTPLWVTANLLNGRAKPDKGSHVEARFDYGDRLTPTGRWSKNRKWVEVIGGESGTVWCDIRYLSEREDVFTVYSLNPGSIRARIRPGAGKITGKIKKGERIEITQVVLGYGLCKKGWVDLGYFIEEES